MKYILFFSASLGGLCQSTFPIQMPSEASISVTMSAEAVASTIAGIVGTPASATTPSALSSDITNSQTTLQVGQALNVQTCMGVLIGSELSLVTAIAGSGPFTLTVVRGTVGTTRAAHSSGATVSYTAWGEGGCFLANVLTQGVQAFMAPSAFPGPTVAAAKIAIATQQSTISSTVTTGVTHVP